MTSRHRRAGCLLGVFLALAYTSRDAIAHTSAPEIYHLTIANQPLGDALQDFSRQSGIQVIFFSALTDGIRAPALDGDYSAAAALNALLANSGLIFRVINARTVQIKSTTAATPHSSGNRHTTSNRGSST
jgi:iron complex outermembrane recepter protein